MPRLYPDVDTRYLVFEGKQDLENNLARRIRGWRAPDSYFIVLRDQDSGDCRRVKSRLTELVAQSGRTALVRVACRQLEAWIVGDLQAVAEAYERPQLAEAARKEKFRDPDRLGDPADDLRKLLGAYQKIDGARRVGPRLLPARNTSASFRALLTGLARVLGPVASSPEAG